MTEGTSALNLTTELFHFEQFRKVLHRGGTMAHYMVDSERKNREGRPFQDAIWFPCDKPKPVPAGKRKVYFTVNPCTQIPPADAKGRANKPQYIHSQNDYIQCLNCLYAEFDNKDFGDEDAATWAYIEGMPARNVPPPSVITHSGGGYQCYWLLDETFFTEDVEARQRARHVQAEWVKLVGGDPGVHDIRRLLRAAGTWNMKPKYGPEGKLVHFVRFELDTRYSFEALETLLPEPEPEPTYQEAASHLAQVEYSDDWLGRYIDDELTKEYHDLSRHTEGGRSAELVNAAMRLGSILKADWSKGLLLEHEIKRALVQAAHANGLVKQYGLSDIEREIANGIRQAGARWKPNLFRRYGELATYTNGHAPEGPEPLPAHYNTDGEYDPPLPQEASQPRPLSVKSAYEILTTDWPEPVWVVPGMLPAGLTLFAGRQKLGKSWLALQIAGAVSLGGVALGERVEEGGVLYLALEDNWMRLKKRMLKQNWPPEQQALCDFMTLREFTQEIGDFRKGGGDKLAQEIVRKKHRLVVVDTLSRAVWGNQSDVDEMTRWLSPLQTIAFDTNCAIVLIDHHRKSMAENADAIADILGSTAKGGVSDTIWGLYRERGKSGAKLSITGRDVEERTLALKWDHLTGIWQMEGDADAIEMTAQRQKVLDAIKTMGPSTLSTIVEVVGEDKSNTYHRLQDLVGAGLLYPIGAGRGMKYALAAEQATEADEEDDLF